MLIPFEYQFNHFIFKDQRCLEDASNEILTAIVHGMKREEPSDHVRLAATNALLNSLEFTKANFDKEVRIVEFVHRDKIYNNVWESTPCIYKSTSFLFYRLKDISLCKSFARLPRQRNAK